MKRLLAITLVLSLAVSAAVIAQPARQGFGGCDRAEFGRQARHEGRMGGPGHRNPGLRGILAHGDEINLTDDQRDKLEVMQTTFQMEGVDQKAKVEKARITLKALMRDEASTGEVNAAIDEVSRLQAEMKKMRYRHLTEAKSVLTEDQLDKLKSLRKNFRQHKRPGGCGMGRFPASDSDG